MGIFEEFWVKTKTALGVASAKIDQLLNTAILNVNLIEVKNQIRNEFIELGKISYNCYKNKPQNERIANAIVKKIDKLREKVVFLKNEIEISKNKVSCKNCGQKNNSDSIFCSKCGNDIENYESSNNSSDKYDCERPCSNDEYSNKCDCK